MEGENWHAHAQAMDDLPLPVRSFPHRRPSQIVKARRRTSGLGYIRDENGSHPEAERRNTCHTGHIPSVATKEGHNWSSPELFGPSPELHRGWRMPGPSGTFAETSPHALKSWKYMSNFSSSNDKALPVSRLDKFEFYAPSSITTNLSSPPSSSSPMFSEPTTLTTKSQEIPHRAYRASTDVFLSPPLHPQPVHPPHPASTTRSPPNYGLGLSILPEESGSSRRRMAMDYQGSQQRRARRLMSMPVSLPSSSSSDCPDAHLSPSHSGLDRWFPGLMYAFEPPYDSHNTPVTEFVGDSIGLDEESYCEDEPTSPGEPASPPLRSLQLVSKYFGDDTDISSAEVSLPETAPHPRSRRMSAGELHGLNFVSPGDIEHDMDEPVAPTVSHLRPLHLAEMHRSDAHVTSRHTHSSCMGRTPTLSMSESRPHDDESDASSWHQSLTRRSRVPFAALHPRPENPKGDPDAIQLFWFGFIGMPWLWLLGGWCLNDHGALLSPWSPPSFAAYRAGLHPYGPPFALSLHAKNRLLQRISPHTISPLTKDPVVFGDDHRGVQFLAQHPPDSVRLSQLQQWQHVERFVLINRIAVALSSFTFFACWSSGVWTIVSHF
ncbi:Uncharacterized protein MSYG_0748 [Malassezia sympodialis ATCC 42132]|uniref:Uncharacterized protein n=1 Tax=Malassezia sympodialis (strain ATCC 42132) TaxID=1230383 RepID=A0A1M8A1R1_MALS4|nr:Uncharacterized protein MSYG_0748 [Malassezia sympodialis ATCC 42132]